MTIEDYYRAPDYSDPFPRRKRKSRKVVIEGLIGELVVVSHWQDFKLEDATVLGILREYRDGYFYVVGSRRGFRHCRKVMGREI